jgi:hypothetical protein
MRRAADPVWTQERGETLQTTLRKIKPGPQGRSQ